MTESQDPQPRPGGRDGRAVPQENGLTFIELLLVLSRGRGLIVLCIVGMGLLAGLYAVATPSQYTATSKVVREAGDEDGGGLPGGLPSVSGFGLNIGGSAAGLTPASYPEIATSREVRLAVARDTFYFPSTGRRTTFVDHVNQPTGVLDRLMGYTVYLPWTLKSALGEVIQGENRQPAGTDSTDTAVYPSQEEEAAIATLRGRISVSVAGSGALEEGSGLMTISTTAADPTLAARLNERVIEHLRTRVRELRTETTQQNLRFIEERFDEVDRELDAAEDRLAQFLQRNRSVLTGGNEPELEFRRERLRREVRFKEQLYSQLQEQVTQTRLQLQKQQPVVTIAERPVPPTGPRGTNVTLILVLSVLIGGVVGFVASFLRLTFQNREEEPENRQKIREVKDSLTLSGIIRGVRDELT